MSYREALSLAHTAQCKLHLAVDRPDRNLRFIVGHALTVDALNLRLVQVAEEEPIVKPRHSGSVKFRVPGGDGLKSSPLAGRQTSPPPQSGVNVADEAESEVEAKAYSDEERLGETEDDELSLTRFPSAAAQPPRRPVQERKPIKADQPSDNSSDDEELESFLELIQRNLNPESLKQITAADTDKSLAHLYHSVQNCTCHKTDAPKLENFWDVPVDQKLAAEHGFDGMKFALAEITV
jgi:hypothetical protein